MSKDPSRGNRDAEWPDRKAHASLSAIENSVLEGLRSQHSGLGDSPSDHTCLIQLEHELADPTTAAQSIQKL